MALKRCPDCKDKVSDSADHCCHCGSRRIRTREDDEMGGPAAYTLDYTRLLHCPACNHAASKQAPACPACGHPMGGFFDSLFWKTIAVLLTVNVWTAVWYFVLVALQVIPKGF